MPWSSGRISRTKTLGSGVCGALAFKGLQSAAPWTVQRVGHLYRRTTFGATAAQLDAALAAGPEKTIDLIFKGGPGQDEFDRELAPLPAARSITSARIPYPSRRRCGT